jgi:hypothetical protein
VEWRHNSTLFQRHVDPPPKALTEALTNRCPKPTDPKVACQKPATPLADATIPTCPACESPLNFYSDDADLPKADPSQLLEFTLGARIAQPLVGNKPPNILDLMNVDFDVSYVNVAYGPAAMGPVDNDQIGYVGTPQPYSDFKTALCKFGDYSTAPNTTACPGPASGSPFAKWPRFVRVYTDKTTETVLKLPSPLELFSRLGPNADPPTDLENAPNWPTQLWAPVELLRTNWKTFAGPVMPLRAGTCKPTYSQDTFCDAIVDAKKLMMANYENYRTLFRQGKCSGTPITISDDKMIAHVYGWAPFTEADPGAGCGAALNLLENTPGGYKDNNYAEYSRVKLLFDKLNYGQAIKEPLKDQKYLFNPWVVLIHDKSYVGAPNVYAYSVDDAVGNIQADGSGFIVDVGSTKNLENNNLAGPPININYSINTTSYQVNFTHYFICKNDAAHKRPVKPYFTSFVISALDPNTCPVFFIDNKSTPQLYTFKITQPPSEFPFFQNPDVAPKPMWTEQTAAVIDCSGNDVPNGPNPPYYQPSSHIWCCEKLAQGGNGVWTQRRPEPHSAHKSEINIVTSNIAAQTTSDEGKKKCNKGM